MMTLLLPALYTLILWGATTWGIMVVYSQPDRTQRLFFLGVSVLLCISLVGLLVTSGSTEPSATFIAVTCGILAWGWQVASYYLGYVTGLPLPDVPNRWQLTLGDRFRLALRDSLYHELLALGFALLIAAITAGQPNRWGLWIYLALWLMHTSAKLNVFLGVRNFRVEVLPKRLRHLERLLSRRPHNGLFPVSVVLAFTVTLVLFYQAVLPGTAEHHAVGYVLVGTMIGLGLIEHWLLVLPLPEGLWMTFGMQTVPDQGIARQASIAPHLSCASLAPEASRWHTTGTAPRHSRRKKVITYPREHGPLVVDVWEPHHPSGNPPVLLIHGWGGTGSYWHQTAYDLSETVRVIVPDLPGTGRSQPVSSAQNLYDQVDALTFVVDALVPDRLQIVSHSMGSAMAMMVTERRPEQVERLVLTSFCLFLTEQQKRVYSSVMSVFRVTMRFRPLWLAEVPGVSHLMAMRYFHRIPSDRAVLRQGLLDYLELDWGTATACAANALDESIPAAAAAMTHPTLLIACRQDSEMPIENVDYTAEVVGDTRVHWIEGCGHLPMVEKPEEYMELLRGFLRMGENDA